jgi:hypothetical protein
VPFFTQNQSPNRQCPLCIKLEWKPLQAAGLHAEHILQARKNREPLSALVFSAQMASLVAIFHTKTNRRLLPLWIKTGWKALQAAELPAEHIPHARKNREQFSHKNSPHLKTEWKALQAADLHAEHIPQARKNGEPLPG